MVDHGKVTDRMLDKISELRTELEQAKADLAAERVAHRVTRKELAEVVAMKLSTHV